MFTIVSASLKKHILHSWLSAEVCTVTHFNWLGQKINPLLYCIVLYLFIFVPNRCTKALLAQSKGQFLGRNKQLGAGNTFFLATLFWEFLPSQRLSEKKPTCLPQETSGVPLQQQNQKILPFQKSIIGLFRTQRVGELGSQMYCTVPNGTQDQLRSINQF